MDIDELLDTHDAVGLAGLVRDGQVAPRELLDAVATRIETRDPHVRAVVANRVDEARAEIEAGLPDGPLRGVPFMLKDLGCDIAGLPSTEGSRLFADAVAADDGILATRYRRAGLVLVGKTSTPEFGKNSSTESVLHGRTANPWNLAHSSGGSSGGSSAAVAAGIVPAAHANDGGGSTRIPASYCGLVGLKPTRGRVPDDRGRSAFGYPFAVAHALTRTVRDSAALLDAVSGPLPGDAYASPAGPAEGSFLAALGRVTARLRIAVAWEAPNGTVAHPAAVRAVERTAATLSGLGHHVEAGGPVWDMAAAARASAVIMAAAVRMKIQDRLAALGRTDAGDDIEPFTRYIQEATANLHASDLARALRTAELTGRQVAPFFERFDVWLTPTVAIAPPPLGLLDTTDPAAMARHAPSTVAFTQVFNVTGAPAVSVPAGFDEAGLPVGVQLAGRFGAEADLLGVAAELERAAPWPWQAPWNPTAAVHG